MRFRRLARLTALVAASTAVVFGCAQIAGLDDTNGAGGSSGTSGNTEGGAGVAGDIQLDPPGGLDFSSVDCGKETTKTLTIYNRNPKYDATYKLTSSNPLFVVKTNGEGTIKPSSSVEVIVAATPTLAQVQDTGLRLELNGDPRPYTATVVGQGATIELSQTAIDFGDVRKENGGEAKITVKNGGGKPLGTTFEPTSPTTDFEVTPTIISAAPRDGTAEMTVKMKSGPSNAAPVIVTFKPKAAGVCGTIPTLEVRGKRITTDVTVDAVDWGDIVCKSTPGDRDATIKNYGTSPVNYTSTLGAGTFAIISNGSGTVPGGSETNPATQKIRVRVTPGAVPGQKDDTLTLNYGTGQSSTGKVRAYVVGLVLNFTPATSTFSSDGGTEQRKSFNITNSGKFGGYVGIGGVGYTTTGSGFRAENGTGSYQNYFGLYTSGGVDVVFKATQAGATPGTLVATGTAVCSQNSVTLTGNNP